MSQAAYESGLSEKFSPLIFLIPAIFDLLASTSMLIGLYLITASVYQMINSFNTVITALFSVLLLKRKL